MDPLSTCAALDRITRPGGEEAWAILIERHGPAVWRMITSRYADVHLAEDAYQEFWLALPNAAKAFTPDPIESDSERKAQAWLVTVAYRVAIMEHRRRRPTHPLGDEPATAPAPDPDEPDERARQLARLQRALDQLPERYRRPIVLHLVGGMPYEDLAQELRCTVNNARVMVHRGLARLRQLLGDQDGPLAERTLAGLLPPLLFPPPPATPSRPAATILHPPPRLRFRSRPRASAAHTAPVPALGTATTLVIGSLLLTALHTPRPPTPPAPPASAAPAHATTTSAPAASPVLDDFERADPLMLSITRQFAELRIIPAPDRPVAGRALRIAWPDEHHAFVDCVYRDTRAAPAFTADHPSVATIRLWTTAGSGAAKFSLRFVDAKGEVWQWTTRIPDTESSGWRTLSIPLTATGTTGHWGSSDTLDGVLDFPMRLNGYGVQFSASDVPAGAVVIDDVTLTTQ